MCKNNGIPFEAWRLYHWSTYDYGQGTRSRTWASRFQTACATVTPYPAVEAQTFFGVAAPIYPTHKPLSTQCFTSIVVANNRHFLLAWGPPPWSSISLLLVRESRLCCACLVGAILLCAYLVEHEGIEPSCRALPNAGFNARSDRLCPKAPSGRPRCTAPACSFATGTR